MKVLATFTGSSSSGTFTSFFSSLESSVQHLGTSILGSALALTILGSSLIGVPPLQILTLRPVLLTSFLGFTITSSEATGLPMIVSPFLITTFILNPPFLITILLSSLLSLKSVAI